MAESINRYVAVVEDDRSSRSALGRLLMVAGWQPVLFDSAEAFLAARRDHVWRCVIVDVQLGGMSGLDLQQNLQAAHDASPVIVVTGNQTAAVRQRAERAGCAAFLTKPYGGDDLLSVLDTVGSRSRT